MRAVLLKIGRALQWAKRVLTRVYRPIAVVRKREYMRNRQMLLRIEHGCVDRKTYEETSLSRLKPWEDDGISRSTWYRRRRTGGRAA